MRTEATLLHRLRWLPALLTLLVMAVFREDLTPAVRLFLAAPVLYTCFKFAAIAKQRTLWASLSLEARFWYLTLWPGMDLRPRNNRDLETFSPHGWAAEYSAWQPEQSC